MTINADAAYLALKARDRRFDGRLFVGVTSTRIYCRPVCRVRTPKRDNCRFYGSAAQAEAAGFRPCLKCRPEIAPADRSLAWSVMDASRTLAHQAAAWLEQYAALGEQARMDRLAAVLGITDRHLRRIFAAEHGVTPLQYLQTRRLLLAKQLLTDTRLPVTQVALAAGFGSVRRFNAAFAERYRLQPGELRRQLPERDTGDGPAVNLQLAYREPYEGRALLGFLAQRAIPGVEVVQFDGPHAGIRRSLRIEHEGGEQRGWLQASFVPGRPVLRIALAPELAHHSAALLRGVRRWLDLDAEPEAIDAVLAALPAPGTRLPGAIDSFELAVRAVLGQQVSVAAARTFATRLVQAYGEPVATPWDDVNRLFPTPAVLARADAAGLGELGIVRQRAGAIVALATQWPSLSVLIARGSAPEALMAALQALPGIGPWTAHYIAMRALAWPDAFLPKDVALLKAMEQVLGVRGQRAADLLARQWSPWRSYAVLRLWAALTPSAEKA
ncbi:helix-turn-helix domain-containing protein [Aquabacterium sp. A7-Y]|uniref:Ada metal-binding domain-containing protein n=1 Tax=Aquabacterium sp. A7-Y TaxID=1349605 RepID=UPI00223CA886|nr:Ada metal-binding domain-containing protein [Aquabacterium sp. A7-Y]MCW7538267.1 helix-turn-helix domain-containing protein [Aquabacterium sp. A7-Y]